MELNAKDLQKCASTHAENIFTYSPKSWTFLLCLLGLFRLYIHKYSSILINGCQKLYLTDQLDWLLRIGSLLRGRDLVPLLACISSSSSTSSPPLSSRCCCDFALVRLLPLPLPCPVAGLNSSAPAAVPCVRSALLCTSRPLLLDLPPSNPPPLL